MRTELGETGSIMRSTVRSAMTTLLIAAAAACADGGTNPPPEGDLRVVLSGGGPSVGAIRMRISGGQVLAAQPTSTGALAYTHSSGDVTDILYFESGASGELLLLRVPNVGTTYSATVLEVAGVDNRLIPAAGMRLTVDP